MICCNKCGAVIPEPKEEPKEEESPGKSRYKKDAANVENMARRSSLISMPTSRSVKGFNFEDVDLCVNCKSFLNRWLNEMRYRFMSSSSKIEDSGDAEKAFSPHQIIEEFEENVRY